MYMYADEEVHKKELFYFIYCTRFPKNVFPLYMSIQLSLGGVGGGGNWTQGSLHKWVKCDCRGECCPEYNDCCWLQQRWSWVILYPNCFLNNSSQYCTPFSGLYFLLFLVTTPPWSKFLSSNSLWSYTLSKMMSFIIVQWCLSLVWHCTALETEILRRRSESTAYVCFGLVCGILSYIYVHVNDFRIAKIY